MSTEKRNNDVMLWRALLLSVALHLLILLGGQAVPYLGHSERTKSRVIQSLLIFPASIEAERKVAAPKREWSVHSRQRRASAAVGVSTSSSGADQSAMSTRQQSEPVPRDALIDESANDGLRQYRLDLAREARRYKRYPPMAREQGEEGVVMLRVRLAGAAALPDVTLLKSSGSPALDADALALVGGAARLTSMPESLRGLSFTLDVPVSYSIRD